ncbi:hypothetical protein BJ741DRAFT_598637 [Chytriomyces cf. hyalinus JEL632]|nr:hypothetical protein BJ741DRAFT_598637 [Chytriomyces cf. hyalinus JEL632]
MLSRAGLAVLVLVTAPTVSAQWDQLVSIPSVGCFALPPDILPPPVPVDGPMMPYRCLDKCSNGVALIAPSMSNEWVFECFCVAGVQSPAATASCTAPCPGASNPSQAPQCGAISHGGSSSSTVRILSAYANPGTQVLFEPPPEKVVQVPVPEPAPVPLLPVQPEQPSSVVAPGPPVFPVNPGVVVPSPVPVAPTVGTGDPVSGGSASSSVGVTGSAGGGGVSGTLNQGVSNVGGSGNSGSSSNGQQGLLPGVNAGSSTSSSNNSPSVNGGTKPVGGFAPQGGQQDPTSASASSNTPNSNSNNSTMIASISIFSILIVGFAVVAAQRRRRSRSRDSESAGSLTPEMDRNNSRSMNVSAADNVFSFYSEPAAATLSRTDAPSSPLPVPPASRLSRTSSASKAESGKDDTVDRPESPVVEVSSARSSASMSGSLVFANEVDPNELKEIISEYEGSFVEEGAMVEGVSDSKRPGSAAAAVV